MARRKPLHSGSGVFVPEGLGGYLDAGGIGVATRIQQDQRYVEAVKNARQRIVLLSVVFSLCFLVICGKLFAVTLLPSLFDKPARLASWEDTRERADIVDRHGNVLATNLTSIALHVDTREVWNVEKTISSLRSVLPDLSEARLKRQLTSGGHDIELARKITPRQKQQIFSLGLPGIKFPKKDRRYYPRGRDAAHVLGYVDVDNQGIAGVENFMNEQIIQAGIEGGNVALSLDMRVQHILSSELLRTVQKFNANAGAGVIMDVHTGEVIAMASLPDFDPNNPLAVPTKNRFNQATKGVYELGSVFKMFTIAMALDNGSIKITDGYDTSKPLRIANFTINDFHGENRWLTIPEIFVHSSNIGTAKIARAVGISQHQKFLNSLGMYDPVEIELPERGYPSVPSRWREVRAATISYGHGIAVSPLHLATAAASMVNGGLLFEPTLLKAGSGKQREARQVISPATSKKMRDLLRLVVTNGTGRNAEVEGYFVGGKTGTAEKSTRGGYARKALLSSFIATFPTYDPQYVVYVMLDEPKGIKETYGYATAGWTAAPLTKRIIERMGPVMGIAPNQELLKEVQQAAFSRR